MAKPNHAAWFMVIWNANRGKLPSLRKQPSSAEEVKLIDRAWNHFDGDGEAMAKSIRVVATDDHYIRGRYGFEAFCRHLGRWGGAADDPDPEPTLVEIDETEEARRIAEATGGHYAAV